MLSYNYAFKKYAKVQFWQCFYLGKAIVDYQFIRPRAISSLNELVELFNVCSLYYDSLLLILF